MTYCHLLKPFKTFKTENFSMPPIIHQRLQILRLTYALGDGGETFLGSLTLPCLQEFHTDEIISLTYLPALVHRSSCPLTNITLFGILRVGLEFFGDLHLLRGLTDLVCETVDGHASVVRLLLDGYFPDLHNFTLRLQPFLSLWYEGIFHELLDRKGPRPDSPNEGRFRKLLVVDPLRGPQFDDMWKSDVGKELKMLNIRLRADGFEFV
jgi:hypothetical protein